MKTVIDVQSPVRDRAMLVFSALAFLAGVVGFHWAGEAKLMGLGLLGLGLLASGLLGFLSPSGQRFVGFAREASHEARRVHWPTRKETIQTTGIVFMFVLIMAVFLWLADKSLEWLLYSVLLGWKA